MENLELKEQLLQGIYCIEQISSKRKYFGSSKNIDKRLDDHFKSLKSNNHHNIFMQRAYNKHGELDFKCYIVEEVADISDLFITEQKYIDTNIGGFNIAPAKGGDMLSNHPDRETIIKKRTITKNQFLSTLTVNERKEKYGSSGASNGNWKGGVKYTCPLCGAEKAKTANVCGKCRDRRGENNPFYRRKHSEDSLSIMRKKAKENCWTKNATPEEQPYTKKYRIVYKDGTIKEVFGLKIIAEEFGCSITNVQATIERMANGIIPMKRSRFYGVLIECIPRG